MLRLTCLSVIRQVLGTQFVLTCFASGALRPSEIHQDEPLRKTVHEQAERIRAQGESQMAQELMSTAPATIETADTMNVILEGPALDWNTVETRQIRFGVLTWDAE